MEKSPRVELRPRSSVGRRLDALLAALLPVRCGRPSGDSVRLAAFEEDLGLLAPVRALLLVVLPLVTDSDATGEVIPPIL